MRTTLYLAAAVFLLPVVTTANAGLLQWSSESEADPFTGGMKITVDFMSTLRSGVWISCETPGQRFRVRAIPGFDYTSGLELTSPNSSFAVDGKVLFEAGGEAAQVGNNLAAVDIELDAQKARQFVNAFAASKKQIAIQDGISDSPHLLTARGSTKAGKVLLECIDAQKAMVAGEPVPDIPAKDLTLGQDKVEGILSLVRQSVRDASKRAGDTDAIAQNAGQNAENGVRTLMGLPVATGAVVP